MNSETVEMILNGRRCCLCLIFNAPPVPALYAGWRAVGAICPDCRQSMLDEGYRTHRDPQDVLKDRLGPDEVTRLQHVEEL